MVRNALNDSPWLVGQATLRLVRLSLPRCSALIVLIVLFIGCFGKATTEEDRKSDSPRPTSQKTLQNPQGSPFPSSVQAASKQQTGGAPIEWANESVSRQRLEAAIHRAAGYLVRHNQTDGRFVYLTNTDPDAEVATEYNMLRHLGTMYALAMYQKRFPREQTLQTLKRAWEFARRNSLGPVEGGPQGAWAAWSRPDVVYSGGVVEAKLGGAGLALLSLTLLEELQPGLVEPSVLSGLAKFVVYMQKESGEFYAKYIPSKGGRNDEFQSQYYPGEAAYGLLMLYKKDGNEEWLRAASRAIAFLARSGKAEETPIPDHWMLLACVHLMPEFAKSQPTISQEQALAHIQRTVSHMIADQFAALDDERISGCYTPDGRVCPTATRLEGLLASLSYFPAHDQAMRSQIRISVRKGMKFLLSCQIKDGRLAGGLPCISPALPASDPRVQLNMEKRMGEIRIDYVQHSLSAMLQYLDLLGTSNDQ